ncbi:MAG: Eco57I restriction-modification methylase domain-containing protein, partial [Promethearchaeota archaeon]
NFHYTKPFDYDNYGEFNKEGDHQFSWILSFPEIFLNPSSDKIWKETPGFSIILNNPPWEMAQLNDKEFFTHYNNSYPILSRNEKNRFKAETLADSKLSALYKEYQAKIRRRNQFWNENFYLQGEQKYNLYKLFLERIYDLIAPAGVVSIIVPAGILGEYRANLLRAKLFSSFSVSHILQLYTGKYFFPSIVSGQPLAILSFFKTDPDSFDHSQSICFCGNIQTPPDLRNLPNQMFLSLSFLKSITSRSSIVIPLLNLPDEVNILQQLLRYPKLSSGWNIDARRELNRTDDEKNGVIGLIHTYYPVLEGKHLVQFGYSLENARFFVQDPKNYHKYKPYSAFERIIWRNVSNIRLRRRMFCTIIPPNIATVNSLNYLIPKEPLSHTHEELLYLCGMLGSLVAEFFLRLFSTNNNLNQYLILNLPVPFYDSENYLHLRLIKVLSNFIPIANQWARRMVKLGKQSTEKQKLEREYWPQMREIDVLACRIYGISAANFNIIKKKFPKIEPDYFTGFPKW